MASILRFAAVAAFAATAVAQSAVAPPVATPQPSVPARLGSVTHQGCFASKGSMKNMTDSLPKGMLNTNGLCGTDTCFKNGFKVGATQLGFECWCGNEYPALNARVDDKNCNVGCPGFGEFTCGGEGYWTVYNTGKDIVNVKNSDNDTYTPPSESTTKKPTASATGSPSQETTIIVSAPAENKPGPNIGGIVAGVVIGVLAIIGIAAGIFFFMRRKRNQEIEEEHRRNMAVNSFVGKPPSSSDGFSDTRMDPGMAQRRMSSGSIEDNQDYSRKILRVTNA